MLTKPKTAIKAKAKAAKPKTPRIGINCKADRKVQAASKCNLNPDTTPIVIRPEGRPTKYDDCIASKILLDISQGGSKKHSAIANGIAESTLYLWCSEYPEFSEKVDAACSKAAIQAEQGVWKGRDGWQGPARWKQAQDQGNWLQMHRQEHSGIDGKPIETTTGTIDEWRKLRSAPEPESESDE